MENKFITLGCRLNTFESEAIKEQLKNNNITNKVIINTCAVTKKAEKDSLSKIKKLKKMYPNKELIVTGCAVHTALNQLKNMTEVDRIIDNPSKLSIESFIGNIGKPTIPNINNSVTHNKMINKDENLTIPIINNFKTRTRAFVQIQQGCDHRCSFCIIHKTRGKSISFNEANIIKQIQNLVYNNYKDITLTGVDISSWKRDISANSESKLGLLCLKILKHVPKLNRLRLSSLDPAVEDHTLLTILKNEERLMPHLHLSLQSLNNNVLNNMGRRHSKETALEWITKLRNANSNLVLGADIICGFPKETEEYFFDTYQTLKLINIPLLHVFPYSERSNTPAAKMEQIPHSIRKNRAIKLIELANSLKMDFWNSKLGKIEEVLVESNNLGYTKDYSQVKILNKPITKNTLIKTLIKSNNNSFLIGEALNV